MAKLPPHMQHCIAKTPEPVQTPSVMLDYATKLALEKKIALLEMDLPGPKDMRPEAQRHRVLIASVADSTINQKIKVDETQLRQRSEEFLPALLEKIEKALKPQ